MSGFSTVGGPGYIKHQANQALNQAAPVQNTWYTIFTYSGRCVVIGMGIQVDDTGETLEYDITVDGITYAGNQAAVAGTPYRIVMSTTTSGIALATSVTLSIAGEGGFLIEGKNIVCRVRKTTANGVGNLRGAVGWGIRQ